MKRKIFFRILITELIFLFAFMPSFSCFATKPNDKLEINFKDMIENPDKSSDKINADIKTNTKGTTPTEKTVSEEYEKKFKDDFNNAQFKNAVITFDSKEGELFKYSFPSVFNEDNTIEINGSRYVSFGTNDSSFTSSVELNGKFHEVYFNFPPNFKVLLLKDSQAINNSGMTTKQGKHSLDIIRITKAAKLSEDGRSLKRNDKGKEEIIEIFQTGVFNFVVGESKTPPLVEALSNFLSSVLENFIMPFFSAFIGLFTGIFTKILAPLLAVLFQIIWDFNAALWTAWFSTFLYFILKILLRFVDWLQLVINILAGIEKVSMGGGRGQNIVNLFLTYGGLKRWFWQITVICIILTFLFTTYTVIRNTISTGGQQQKTMGHILGSGAKAMLAFIMVPFLVIAFLNLMSLALTQVVKITDKGGGRLSIGGYIYVVSSMVGEEFAAKNNHDIDTVINKYGHIDPIYDNYDLIKDCGVFKYSFLLAIIFTLYAIYILIALSLSFVVRLIEIVMLYLIAPFFAASISLDDGQKFGMWREFFISRVVTGYSVIITMNIFFLFIPWMWSNNVIFDDHSSILNIVARIIIFFGGLHAASRMDSLILNIISFQVGSGASESMQVLGGMMRQGAASGIQSLTGLNVAPLLSAGAGQQQQQRPDPSLANRFRGRRG